MKKQLLIVSLFVSGLASAQGTMTQANEPAIGATQSMYLCDSSVTAYSNENGNAAIWDYSQILGSPGQMRTISIVDPSTSAYASDFPGATKAIEVENFLTTFWTSSATERTSNGYVFEEPTFGTVKAMFDDNPQTLVSYPFAFSNSVSDLYEGTLSFDFNGFPQTPDALGTSFATIDGIGTLKLNAATTLTNVIRYKMVDTLRATIALLSQDIEVVRVQYEYYNDQIGMPLFTHSVIVIQNQGSTTPLTQFSMVLSSVQPDEFLGTNKLESFQFGVYPNPVTESFSIQGNFTGEFTAEILDQTGKVVQSVENGFAGKAIETSNLKSGIYFVKVNSNEGTATQKFVKK